MPPELHTGAAPLQVPHNRGHSAHKGRPLFVLSTARRRRSKSDVRRGGYYALSTGKEPKGVPVAVKALLAFMSVLTLFWLSVLLIGAAALYGGYLYFSKDLPSIDNIHAIQFETTHIYDRNGKLLYEMFDPSMGKRNYVTVDQMPPDLIHATIAVEDSTFEQNNGVDPVGIVRAVYINLTDKGSSGASTITQQLVRRVLLPEHDELSFKRKIREAILATRVTQQYSKEKILEIYLNEIYYGSLSYGVDAAANTYFGKRVKDLTLAQCALLAGLPQAPGEYDPNHNYDAARARQKIVLDMMVKNRYITPAQEAAAYAEDVRPIPRTANVPAAAPHFVQYVQQVLEQKYGEELATRGGLKVFTTIDLSYQAVAQRIAIQQIDAIKRQGASNAAIVAVNPRTGEILAMVGSVDYTDPNFGQVNVATALRQPGSSFKPFTYATALERGDYTPDSILPDLPAKFTNGASQLPYVPQNYDMRFHGPVTMRSALANSFNIPAVEMLQAMGVPAVLNTAHKMGITTLNDPTRYGLALTLGGGEVTLLDMTSSFGVFANGGVRVPVTPFLKITDSRGNVLEQLDTDRPIGKRVLDSGVAYQISDILSDNAARTPMFGPSSALKIQGIDAAVKTGTTNDWKDSWTVGYTPALAVGVWVGNNDGRVMSHVAGAIGAAPIWHDFIQQIYADPRLQSRLLKTNEKELPTGFHVPPGMVHSQVCAQSGMAPGPACPDLKWGWYTQNQMSIALSQPDNWHVWMPVTLHDGGATVAGAGVPVTDTIQRIFTIPPEQYRGWIGGGPPITVTLPITPTAPVLPTPVKVEPASIASMITPIPGYSQTPLPRPAGLQQPGNIDPIPGLQLSILSPGPGDNLQGVVNVVGAAWSADFARYRLEVTPLLGGSPTLIADSPQPVSGGTLGIWVTDGLPSGQYILSLTIQTQAGQVARTDVTVQVGFGSPSVAITSPADNSPVYNGEALDIQVSADGGGVPLAGVEIYADGKRLASLTSPPWAARWAVITGTHEFAAVAYTVAGQQAKSAPVHVMSEGVRPTPTPTIAPIMWISNLTEYKELKPGVNDVWVDVQPNSTVKHVDIYIDGFPAGYATGPGFRANPSWTSTPPPSPTTPPTPTMDVNAAATATQAAATAQVQSTRVAVIAATRIARSVASATARAGLTATQVANAAGTATAAAATASPTPMPPTMTPSVTPTATFVRYSRLPDPMLGDYVARCMFKVGRHRVTAIGYDENNIEVSRDEAWVVVR